VSHLVVPVILSVVFPDLGGVTVLVVDRTLPPLIMFGAVLLARRATCDFGVAIAGVAMVSVAIVSIAIVSVGIVSVAVLPEAQAN